MALLKIYVDISELSETSIDGSSMCEDDIPRLDPEEWSPRARMTPESIVTLDGEGRKLEPPAPAARFGRIAETIAPLGLRAALGGLPLVAEDLGDIDDGVRALLRDTGLPGMRVLQFGLLDQTSTHHPANHVANAVAYTGTHDNDTARGWFEALTVGEQARVLEVVGGDAAGIAWAMIRCAMASPGRLAIVPMQGGCRWAGMRPLDEAARPLSMLARCLTRGPCWSG